MACSRRTLASGFSYLSRRSRVSVATHLATRDDRDAAAADTALRPIPFPPHSQSLPTKFGSLIRDRMGLGFLSTPLGVELGHRNYSSSASESNEVDYLKDAAEILTDASIEAAASVPAPFPGEVAAAAADSFLPVAALQHLMDAIHSFTGLNWWASIALTTLLIRGATLPLLINQMKATVKLNSMRPELEEIKLRLDNSMDPTAMQEGQKEMQALFRKHGVTPFTPLKGIFIQGPVFVSFFMAISNMVEKVPSFKGGGTFWFTDLTTPDAMYIFPVITALTFWLTVELNMQEGMEGNPMANTMKNFSRVLAVVTVPFTASFPKAIFCYWVTSNLFSLTYGLVLKRPAVRKFLSLPDIVPQSTPATQPSFSFNSFFGGSKAITPASPPMPAKESEQPKFSERKVSSSSVISQRIRNLEKTVKNRSKPKKR